MRSATFVPLAVTLALVTSTASAAPRTLWVAARGTEGCPAETAVVGALRSLLREQPVRAGAGGEQDLALLVAARGRGALQVELRDGGALLADRMVERRAGRSAHACADLAQTVALVGATWLRVPRAAGPASAPASAPVSAATAAAAAAPVSAAAAAAAAAAAPVSAPAPAPAPAAVSASATASAGDPLLARRRAAPPLRAGEGRVELRVAAGAAFSLGGASSTAPAGSMALDIRLARRWAVGLRAGVEGSSATAGLPGEVRLRHVPLAVVGDLTLLRARRVSLSVAAGPLLEVVLASGVKYRTVQTRTLWEPGLLLAPRVEWRAWRGLGLFAEAGAMVLLRTDELAVANVGVVGRTPRWRLSCAAGAAWRI